MKENLYIFSGLGADKTVFDKVDFLKFNPIFIDWIEPHKNESLELYAKRISKLIVEKKTNILGISFGGMIAVEIAKLLPYAKLILISTSKSTKEFPFLFYLTKTLNFHKLLPLNWLTKIDLINNFIFGITNKENQLRLKKIIQNTDLHFLKWAINAILRWKNKDLPTQYIQIHGVKDRILPIKKVKFTFEINNGGHLLPLSNANQISQILNSDLC